MSAPDPEAKLTPTQRRAGKKTAAIGCGAILALVPLIAGTYLVWANHLPPPPTKSPLPVPNGFDAILAAAGEFHGGKAVFRNPQKDSPSVRAEVAANRTPLAHLRAALRLPCVDPEESNSALYPTMARIRTAADFLRAEAYLANADGRTADAVDHCLDCVELGARGSHGSIIGYLVAVAFAVVGREAAMPMIGHLSAREAQSLGERTDRIIAEYALPEEVIHSKCREDLRSYHSMLITRPDSSEVINAPAAERWAAMKELARWPFVPKPMVYRQCERFSAEAVEQFKKPFPRRRIPSPPRPWLVAEFLASDADLFSKLSVLTTRETCLLRLFRLRLALQEFRALQGDYPADLNQIRSRVSAETLTDPFSEQPLRYRREQGGYRLYSVGPDGRDDGGKPLPQSARANPSAKGDIVALVRADGSSPPF